MPFPRSFLPLLRGSLTFRSPIRNVAAVATPVLLPLGFAICVSAVISAPVRAQSDLPPGGTPVLAPSAFLETPVGGLERTGATTKIVPITGQPFERALRVVLATGAPETNATQLTIRNAAPIEKGDVLLLSFFVRGRSSAAPGGPAQAQFLFEKATSPWTKSTTRDVFTVKGNGTVWRRVIVPFTASESYTPGEAMASLRFAFGPQTVEVGGLTLVNYAKARREEDLVALAAERQPLGSVQVSVNLKQLKQTMRGFGGNFAQPRYGFTQPMDAVGQYNLDHLRVAHARVGIPLDRWVPEPGVYKEEAQAKAALLQMQLLSKRHIPITGSIWEGPLWMLGGKAEESGRTLPPERYKDCIEAIARFLVTARDHYGVTVENVSFNEPDYGVNFKFTPEQMADFIRQAGPRFRALGLKTRFLIADTANGSNSADYARVLLADKTIAPYLGPFAFHGWDVLGAADARYEAIAALGRQYKKPIWCTEAGHDAQLWQAPNPWVSWDNALRTALAYERTLRLSGAELIDYWTYQDNYPLVNKDGKTPFPVWKIVRQMEDALPAGSRIATASASNDDLKVLPAAGPKPGQFSALLVNPIGPGTATMTGLPHNASVTIVTSTAAASGGVGSKVLRTDATGRLIVSLPARSVVTVRH